MNPPKAFSDCYQLSIQVFHRTKNYPKHLRPTLAKKLEESTIRALLEIKKASVTRHNIRKNHLTQASFAMDDVKTLIQLSKDMHALNASGFSELIKMAKEIGKELGGLIKYESAQKNC